MVKKFGSLEQAFSECMWQLDTVHKLRVFQFILYIISIKIYMVSKISASSLTSLSFIAEQGVTLWCFSSHQLLKVWKHSQTSAVWNVFKLSNDEMDAVCRLWIWATTVAQHAWKFTSVNRCTWVLYCGSHYPGSLVYMFSAGQMQKCCWFYPPLNLCFQI